MEKKNLRSIKRKLDKVFGDDNTELLKIVSVLLEGGDNTELLKIVSVLLEGQVTKLQQPLKAFRDTKATDYRKKQLKLILDAVRRINLVLPDQMKVQVENIKDFPTEVTIKNLQKFPKEFKITNLKEIINYIKIPKLPKFKFPKRLKISNLKDIKIPSKVDLKKPTWLKQLNEEELLKVMIAFAERMNKKDGIKVDLDKYRDPKKALAVRLSTGSQFYMAVAGAISTVAQSFDNLPFAATTPKIFNIVMTEADTEYSQALPNGTDRFSIQCHGNFDVRFAYEEGKVATPTAPYAIVKSGTNNFEGGLKLQNKTVYVACATADQVTEIITWK